MPDGSAAAAPAATTTETVKKDLFDKCHAFTRPRDLQALGLYTYFQTFGDREGCGPGEILMRGRKTLMFGSNDYLGLITHPAVIEAAVHATEKYGTGCSGSRLLNGTLDLHVETEAALASLVRKDAAMIFGTGFQANYAALGSLAEKGDVLVCDHNLHASLVEGCLRSEARTVRFRHNDLNHLERCLKNCSETEQILLVSEGVFSMEGDLAELPGLIALARKYQARTYVDEAHGIGVLGPTGAGAAEHLGVLDEVDLVMGTFSKSLASVGGFLAGPAPVIDYLKHTARPFVFSASLPAASVAAVRASLEIMRREPERRDRLRAVSDRMRRELRSCGFVVLDGITPIVTVAIQREDDLCRLSVALLEAGIYLNHVVRPYASNNLLRISCTAAHSDAQVDRLIETLARIGRAHGLLRVSHQASGNGS